MTESKSGLRRVLLVGVPVVLGLCLCAVVVVAGYFVLRNRPAAADVPAVEYVLDVSGRMGEPAEGGDASRLVVARGVMAEALGPSTEVVAGLRVFGSGAAGQACEDTNLLVPLEAESQQRIADELDGVEVGQTADAALAPAMIAAIRDLAAVEGQKSLVVITGGQDLCREEAGLLIAQEAQQAGIELRTFIIGFQTTPAEAQAIKEMVDAAGDGLYLDAADEGELKEAMEVVQSYVEKPTAEALAAVEAKVAPGVINLTGNPGISYGPQMVVDNSDRLHLIWWDNSLRPGGDVMYRQRTPGGEWTAAESLTADIEGLVGQYDVGLRLRPDGAVCAFWIALSELQYYQRCWLNGSWETGQTVFGAGGIRREFQPAFAPDGSLHIIYLNGAGDIYSGEQLLSAQPSASMPPRLAVDASGRLHGVWFYSSEPYRIEYRRSEDGGQSWSESEAVLVLDDFDTPTIGIKADAAGNVHLAWSTGTAISYRRWTEAAGWEPAVVVTADSGNAGCDNVGLDVDEAGLVHIAWQMQGEIFHAYQQANRSWTVSTPISTGECSFSRVPVVAIGRDGLVHLVWSLREEGQDVYYAAVRVVKE